MRWPSTLRLALFLSAIGVAGALFQRIPDEEITGFASVIDGDSIRILNREIRLKGIDAPEYQQTCESERGPVRCGREARAELEALAAGLVRCRLVGRDQYHRHLGYCRADRVDLNAAMVRSGRALAWGGFAAEEQEARAAKRGLWATRFERPADWRARHGRRPSASQSAM